MKALSFEKRKHRLESLLKRQIEDRNVQFIAEEADPRHLTVAQRLGNGGLAQR